MASRSRPPRATSSTRKSKARNSDVEAPRPSSSPGPDELERLIRDSDEPLSFLPEEHRSAAARRRVVEQLVRLLNVLREGSNHVAPDVRQTYLTMINVTRTMIAAATAELHEPAVTEQALATLERAAIIGLKNLVPDELPLVPSTHYDLDQKYTLKGSKLALLDVVADALNPLVYAREKKTDGRLDTRLFKSQEVPSDDVARRARQVGERILHKLSDNDAYAKLLVRPADINRIVEDLDHLARVIGVLMEEGNATVLQVARAVLYVFDVDSKGLKNFFSPQLLEEWEASRASRARPDKPPESS